MENWIYDLYLTYNKVFKKFVVFETKWRRNSCANRRRFFQEIFGACSRTHTFLSRDKNQIPLIY